MKVKIEHLIPLMQKRILNLETRISKEAEKEASEKELFDARWSSKFFKREYKSDAYYWGNSPTQQQEIAFNDLHTLHYYQQEGICSTVELNDFSGSWSYNVWRTEILIKYLGEYPND